MSQLQLNLYDLIDDTFYPSLYYEQNSVNTQTTDILKPSTAPITTPIVSTNQNYPTATGSKRVRKDSTRTSADGPVHSVSSAITTHDQNTAKRSKSNISQPMISVPHLSRNRSDPIYIGSVGRDNSDRVTGEPQCGNIDLGDHSHPFSTVDPSYPGFQSLKSLPEDSSLLSAPSLGYSPVTTSTSFDKVDTTTPLPVVTNQSTENTFQRGNAQHALPSLSLPVTTTGMPSANTSLLRTFHSPQGNHKLQSHTDTQDLFVRSLGLQNFCSLPREPSPEVSDLLQGENISWTPAIDSSKAKQVQAVPHIVIDDDLTSSREVDGVSPSSTSTINSSYRSPRSPQRQRITSASTAHARCKVLNPKKEYSKIQKKFQVPRRSEQRVQCGLVKLEILTNILLRGSPEVYVKRESKAAHKLCQEHPEIYTMEEIKIPDIRYFQNEETTDVNYPFCYSCEFDLDSVYLTGDGQKEVYRLVKSKGTFNNLFQLWLKLSFQNGFAERLMPYEFVLKSSRTPPQDSNEESGSGLRETLCSNSVNCRHIQAQTARITNIQCENLQTNNHDIAYYYLKLQCKDDEKPILEKGDVVALLEGDEGDTYIDFLSSENAKEAILAGVITRTAYIKGRQKVCDPDYVDYDLVCIIGEVDVKVHGKVSAGDLIYTSDCLLRRGTAVARNSRDAEIHFADPDKPKPTLLGMAMESYHEVNIKLVRCLVSIVLGISDLQQQRTLEELRNCNNKIFQIQNYLKGVWKKFLLILLFLLVAGTLCYVFLAPKSPYLIMKCEEGCVRKGKGGSCLYMVYDYFPSESQEVDEIIGVNFKWKAIKKKLKLQFSRYPNKTDIYYYLNKNRCVTGNIRAISSWLDTTPQVPRVNVLAVNNNCSSIYYYSVRDGWVAYDKKHFQIKKCEH